MEQAHTDRGRRLPASGRERERRREEEQARVGACSSMRLTLAGLLLCLAIYCGGGFANNGQSNVVLSLPPSLIAAAAAAAAAAASEEATMALSRPAWKKDARVLFDGDGGVGGNGSGNDMLAQSKDAAKYGEEQEQASDAVALDVEQSRDFNRKAANGEPYDLVARQQSAPQEIAQRHGQAQSQAAGAAAGGVKYATPTLQKYWGSRCQAAGGNCAREYNRAMLAVR